MTLSRSTAAVVALLCIFVIAVDFELVGLGAAGGMFNMLAAAIAVGLAALFLFARGSISTQLLRSKPVVALAMFLGWGVCSIAWSADIGATTTTLLAWLMGLATLYLLAGLSVEKALACMVIALTLMCAAGLAFALVSPEAFMLNQGMMRFRGLLFGPHALSGPASIGLAILATGKAEIRRSLFWLCVGVLGASVLLTLSRQAYAAVLLAGGVALYLRMSGFLRPLTVVSLSVAMVALLAWNLLADRSVVGVIPQGEGGDVTTLTGRTEIWHAAIELIGKSPFIGHGFGAGGNALSNYYVKDYGWSTTNAHSAILQVGLDLGLVGLSLLGLLIGYALRNVAWRDRAVGLPLLVCIVAISLVERGFYGAGSFISVVFLYLVTVLGSHTVSVEAKQPILTRFAHG